MTISLSPSARHHLLAATAARPAVVRVAIAPGGCSGMTYTLAIAASPRDTDEQVYEQDDVAIVTDAFSRYFLDGLTIDYSDDLIACGFKLSNTHATHSCGCGASFSM
jgi:iron-sulfur cluster assembly protein